MEECLIFLQTLIVLITFQSSRCDDFGPWSSCSKSCGFGTRTRTNVKRITEEEYCNLQNCPRICNHRRQCGGDGAKCKNNTCICEKKGDFDKITCEPSVGNCVIRQDPPSAIGYRDPSATYSNNYYKLQSCTTNDNSDYEVHVIGIYGGGASKNTYEISIVPRGPVNKPIILFLTSFESTHWKIDTEVGIHKVFYSSFSDSSSVAKSPSSKCEVPVFSGPYEYGFLNTNILRQLSDDFGPITSYTGYYQLHSKNPRIVLQVGGSPLQVLPNTFKYNTSESCSSGKVACPEYYSDSQDFSEQQHWTVWTACSRDCNIGTISRCRYVPGMETIDSEEIYCNTHFCPVENNCTYSWECKKNAEVSNCSIRENSVMALGYKDPRKPYSYSPWELYSCTTVGDTDREVHVIGIFGNRQHSTYHINITQRGPLSKQIILILTSFQETHWRINTPLDVAEVVYMNDLSSVERASNLSHDFKVTFNSDMPYGYDDGAVSLLKYVNNEYGQVTSFTGYWEINTEHPTITLNVGGNPLQVFPRNYIYRQDSSGREVPKDGNMSTQAPSFSTETVFTSPTLTDDICKNKTPCDSKEECTTRENLLFCSVETNRENSTTTITIIVATCVVVISILFGILIVIVLVIKMRKEHTTNNGNVINSDQNNYTYTSQNVVYDEMPASDPPHYTSLERNTVHSYEIPRKQDMGHTYIDIVA